MTRINLYLGAHKTATTHLQGILMANRAVLAARGVTVSAPQDVRNTWLPGYFQAGRALVQTGSIPETLSAPLRAAMPASGTWVLTEENILGVPRDLIDQPGLYPHARNRLATLAALFAQADIRLYFSLRGYDSFWRSMYSEIVRNRGFLPFADFDRALTRHPRSWVQTVADFAAVLPEASIVLWKFEDFTAVLPEALRLISGEADAAALMAAYSTEATRPSLSQKTLDILADIVPVIGREDGLKLTERINAHYAVAAGHAPFQPFDPDRRATLAAQYADDLETIRNRFPGITLLAPPRP